MSEMLKKVQELKERYVSLICIDDQEAMLSLRKEINEFLWENRIRILDILDDALSEYEGDRR